MGATPFTYGLDTAERDAKAARLRSKRWSYRKIALELGFYDGTGARRAIERCLARTLREAGDELRAIEQESLDHACEKLWEIIDGDHPAISNGRVVVWDGKPVLDVAPIIKAMETLLRYMERRAKLLGLDAPTVHRVQTIDALDAEITELSAIIAARATADEADSPAESAGAS